MGGERVLEEAPGLLPVQRVHGHQVGGVQAVAEKLEADARESGLNWLLCHGEPDV